MSADLSIRPLSGASVGAEPVAGAPPARVRNAPDAAQKFEAFVLQSFIQEMLPKTAEGVFGSGVAGDFWRSMMAEKMAEQVAERGNLGIADLVRASEGLPARPGGLVSLDVMSRLSMLDEATLSPLEEKPVSGA